MFIFNVNGMPSVLCSLFLLFLGYFVFLANRSRSNFLFSCLTLSAAIWQIGTALAILSAAPEAAFFWTKFSYIGVTFIPVTMFHFVVRLLGINRYDRYVALAYLIALFVFIPLTWANLFLNGVYQYPWGYWFKATMFHPIYILSYSSLFFLNLLILFVAYRDRNRQDRDKITYLLAALFISYGGALDYLTDYGINVYPIGYIFVVVCLSVIAYAITKARLMDISIVISRGAAWVLTVIFLGSIYGGLVWLYRTYVNAGIDAVFFILTLFYGVIVGESFHKVRLFLQTAADRAFVKGWYDYRKVQRKISSELRKAVSLDDAVKIIRSNLDEELDIARVNVLLPDKQNGTFIGGEFGVPPMDALITKIGEKIDIISKDDYPALPVQLCVPCFSDGQLSALIFLGSKRSEDPYNEQDYDMFRTLSDEISDTFLRIRPYEKVKADLGIEKEKVEMAQKELERTHRLTSLGTLTAGLAHEIRNPMMVLSSKAQLVLEKLDDKEYVAGFARTVLGQIDRILNIVNGMLKFARAKEEGMIKVDVNRALEETLALAEGKIKNKSIEVAKDLKSKRNIFGNPDALSEVFLNIILNGVEFMVQGGILTINTREEGGNVLIEIIDTGTGIPEDALEHIFDPFFTTRAEGTGLGLSIAYRIVKEHGGEISASSVVGKGSKFTISLPAS